jgi:hypothetical protein
MPAVRDDMRAADARRMLVFSLCVATLAGCYGTRSAPATRVSQLKRGGHGREIVLRQGLLGVHVGPRSWVRFALRDGSHTPWVEAGRLRVNDTVIVTTDGYTQPYTGNAVAGGLAWEDLAWIEVNDLDLGKSVVGVCAGTGAVALAATAEILLIGAIEAVTGGHVNTDLGITRGAFDAVAGQVLKRPDDDDDLELRAGPTVSIMDAADALPLFSGRAHRRDLAIFTFATEGGVDVTSSVPVGPGVAGVTVGLRLMNIFEVGVGVRSSLTAPLVTGDAIRVASTPFFRFGLHLDLDAARRVAVAVGADLGGLPGETQARFLFGVRLRLTDTLQVGIYPWNPIARSQTPDIGPAVFSSSRMNLLELSWLL